MGFALRNARSAGFLLTPGLVERQVTYCFAMALLAARVISPNGKEKFFRPTPKSAAAASLFLEQSFSKSEAVTLRQEVWWKVWHPSSCPSSSTLSRSWRVKIEPTLVVVPARPREA